MKLKDYLILSLVVVAGCILGNLLYSLFNMNSSSGSTPVSVFLSKKDSIIQINNFNKIIREKEKEKIIYEFKVDSIRYSLLPDSLIIPEALKLANQLLKH